MRRIGLIITLLSLAAAIGLVIGASAQGSDSYQFDVIFDDARGLIGGQVVKIAGARAGTIDNVVVTPNFKARVEATITGAFRMHTDAKCTIVPEGLIAENYVDCDPGSASAPLLNPSGGYPPTVPVTQTSEPVSLLDLFNIFNLPTRERFQVLVDELGIASAGEGDNFNSILERANPTLALARQVISILDRQTTQLSTIVDATSEIAAQGATHTAAVQNFITRAAALTALTADHASPLSVAINRLPGLLSAAQPALSQLDTVARDGTPLLASIHTAVPYLNTVDDELGPFTAIAKPALADVDAAITKAIPAIRQATPLLKVLHAYTHDSLGNTALFSKLAVNLIQHGFSENFFSVLYYVAAATARYDATSHVLSALLIGPDNGLCSTYSSTPVAACSAHYGSQAAYTPARAHRAGARRSSAAAGQAASTTTPAGTQSGSNPAGSNPSSGAAGLGNTLSSLPATTTSTVQQTGKALQNLVNYLLK